MPDRKSDHIRLAYQSQVNMAVADNRFHYEPILSAHPVADFKPFSFLGKLLKVPIWISSMTGGTPEAGLINHNLARVCGEFGMGMGLGSCRIILGDNTHFEDFDLRDTIGDELPFYANLGIGQVELLIKQNKIHKINDLITRLRADGLIIHVNPLQEWFQPEGDRLEDKPIDTIRRLLEKVKFPVIVKEVGQGMGPASLTQLIKLPLAAIEFGAFGGTNFVHLELMRNDKSFKELYEPVSHIGENAFEMVEYINNLADSGKDILCRQVIISGGIKNFLDGYYLLRKIKFPAIYGQAFSFLKHANTGYDDLHQYTEFQVNGLKLAHAYLTIKN